MAWRDVSPAERRPRPAAGAAPQLHQSQNVEKSYVFWSSKIEKKQHETPCKLWHGDCGLLLLRATVRTRRPAPWCVQPIGMSRRSSDSLPSRSDPGLSEARPATLQSREEWPEYLQPEKSCDFFGFSQSRKNFKGAVRPVLPLWRIFLQGAWPVAIGASKERLS